MMIYFFLFYILILFTDICTAAVGERMERARVLLRGEVQAVGLSWSATDDDHR